MARGKGINLSGLSIRDMIDDLDASIITMTKQDSRPEVDQILISRSELIEAIEAALKSWFYDGVELEIGQYEVDQIIGGVLQRVDPRGRALP